MQLARAVKMKFPQLKLQRIRELPNSFDVFIQLENKSSTDSLMSGINLQQVFPKAKENELNILPRTKSKPSFVIVNVHHSIQEDEKREELLSKN